ncbi:hypothetical protein LMG29739_00372 [Paraburkholderia solisilvae]|uniref:Uncharacterized protein n=1 Tax=Paraburkholderia solisilvae TaxID=624376 RepID=A0A6J5D1B6_9BURK|nr:hypothetical protein LMG29739_00372 [Paraburkholderia solisilvae]
MTFEKISVPADPTVTVARQGICVCGEEGSVDNQRRQAEEVGGIQTGDRKEAMQKCEAAAAPYAPQPLCQFEP